MRLDLKALVRLHADEESLLWSMTDSLGFIYRTGFAYDAITDTEIKKALDDKSLSKVCRALKAGKEPKTPRTRKGHTQRIAALVTLMRAGVKLDPILLEYNGGPWSEPSCIVDGHHRVRAHQFLKKRHIPAVVGGFCRVIEYLKQQKVLEAEYVAGKEASDLIILKQKLPTD